MKPIIPKKILSESLLFGGLLLLLFVVFVLPFSLFMRPAERADGPVVEGLLQEKIGYMIQALAHSDRERVKSFQQQWSEVVQRAKELEQGRAGRLQEILGQAIGHMGHRIRSEQVRLRSAVLEAGEEVRRFEEQKSPRRQEQLGKAVLVASRNSQGGARVFQEVFQREVTRLKKVEARTFRRLESQLTALTIQESEFRKAIPLLYQEAIQSAHRSAVLLEESEVTWKRGVLKGLKDVLDWQRQPEDYMQVADLARDILIGPRWVSGFEEYGLPALLGLLLAMVWVASITRKDLPERRSREALEKTGTINIVSLPHQWKKEVGPMSQSITVFSWPKEVIFGHNVSAEVGRYAAKDDIQQAMILTDDGISHNGLLNPLKSSFSKAAVGCIVYDHVKGEVPDNVIEEVFDQCSKAKTDLIVAVGGGSVIDTAKAVGILLTNGGKIQDYEGVDKVHWPIPHFYVVPTTAGCGSEASQFCVVLDKKRKKKFEIISRRIIPQRVFIDPLLTLTMPPELTASCGMDALANCIEAYFSTWASPLTDALALHAMRLISGSLRPAVANGKNPEARQEMAVAAFEAGLAFTNAHCGAVHALGHPIAGMFNVPQRLGNAILLPHVMRYNMNANMDRMVDVAVAMGEMVGGLSKREAAEKAIAAVHCLQVDIGLPTTLEKVGVKKEAISELSQQALQDAFLRTNPRIPSRQDIEHIYESAFLEYSGPESASTGQRRENFH